MEHHATEQLATWLDALRRHTTLPLRQRPHDVDEALETGVVWLRWTLPSPTEGDQDQGDQDAAAASREMAFQAIELLTLLRRADYDESTFLHLWKATARYFRRPLYRLVEVRGEVFEDASNEKDAFYAEEIAVSGVRVPNISFFHVGETTPSHIAWLKRVFASPPACHYGPVDAVVVDYHASRQTLDSMFSSVLCSDTIQGIRTDSSIDSEDPPRGSPRLMHWLALCVFSHFKCPRLKQLSLSASELQMIDVQHLKQVLLEGDAFITLFPDAKESLDHLYTRASASKFMLQRPEHDGVGAIEPPKLVLDDPIENLRVIAVDDNWVSVLLPGWGQAWTHRSHAALKRTLEAGQVSPRNKFNPVFQLLFNYVPRFRIHALLELLLVIGSGVRSIAFSWEDDEPPVSHDWIRSVCLLCTDLEHIRLEKITCEAFEMLLHCYEEGICVAPRLNLEIVVVEPSSAAATRCFCWLADKNHAIAQHVRDLTIDIRGPFLSPQLPAILTSVLTMTMENDSFYNLDVTVGNDGLEAHRMEAIGILGEHFDNRQIAVRAAPLRIEQKLGFLSILRLLQQQQPALGAVDTVMIVGIFDFAAECKRARVLVSFE